MNLNIKFKFGIPTEKHPHSYFWIACKTCPFTKKPETQKSVAKH